jgi:hypothetical protein
MNYSINLRFGFGSGTGMDLDSNKFVDCEPTKKNKK